MPVSSKKLVRLILLSLICLLIISAPVYAAITGFVAKDSKGEYYEYAYADLLDSYALQVLGLSNGLYEDFAAKKTYALLNSQGFYLDYRDLLDQYAAAIVGNISFNLHDFVESAAAKKAQMPGTVKQVKISAGKIIYTEKEVLNSQRESNPAPDGAPADNLIKGQAQVTLQAAQKWAAGRDAHQRYIDIAPLYWQYGTLTGIRPEVLYAQAAIDTNFGRYGNQVPPEYNNWAGIKTATGSGSTTENYEAFATPEDGVRAHFNHMAAYLGLPPVGEPHGRYQLAATQSWAGTVQYVEDLSGKWAPALDYHVYLLTMLEQMSKTGETTNPPADSGSSNPGSGDNSATLNQVVVDVDILRLRGGPGTEFEILDRLTRGTVLNVLSANGIWLQVTTPGGKEGWVHGNYVSPVGVAVDVFKGKTIVIDPGHGGSDPGAIGATGLQEKVVNLAVAEQLIKMLQAAGANVLTTRSGDQSVSNQQRVDLANKAKAHLFLSIHANAFSNAESNGTETHYCGNNSHSAASKYLAQQLQRELITTFNLRDRGVKANSFFVLTKTEMPAALVELAFLTNPAEEALLADPANRLKAAEALFKGLAAYFEKHR